MTTVTTTTKQPYAGDGVTDTFVFNFPAANVADIKNLVGVGAAAVAAPATVTLNADQNANPGGTVVFDTAPANEGETNILIYRETSKTQEQSYPTRSPFPSSANEEGLDKLTRLVQELQEQLDRIPKAALSPGGAGDLTLPAVEVGKALGWGLGGTLVNLDVSGGGGGGGLVLVSASATYNVGTGGDYSNLNAAIADFILARRAVPDVDLRITLNILTGTTIAEQVFLDGIDLGWLRITSDDAVVPVSRAALTTSVANDMISAPVTAYPFFYARNGARMPSVECVFECDTSGTATDRVGVLLERGAQMDITAGGNCGFNNFYWNLIVRKGARCYANGAEFKNVTGLYSVVAGDGGVVELYAADVSQTTGVPVIAEGYGSLVRARVSTLSSTASVCVVAQNGGKVDVALNINIANTGGASGPLYAFDSGEILAAGATITNGSTGNAVLATDGGRIDINGATVAGTTGPAVDVEVLTGGTVIANGATVPQGLSKAANTVTAAGLIYN